MDDGGQRLLDVIGDPHALESFLKEDYSTLGLDSPRFDIVTSSAEPSLNSSGLDSFQFDGSFLGRSGSHVLQAPSNSSLLHHSSQQHSSHQSPFFHLSHNDALVASPSANSHSVLTNQSIGILGDCHDVRSDAIEQHTLHHLLSSSSGLPSHVHLLSSQANLQQHVNQPSNSHQLGLPPHTTSITHSNPPRNASQSTAGQANIFLHSNLGGVRSCHRNHSSKNILAESVKPGSIDVSSLIGSQTAFSSSSTQLAQDNCSQQSVSTQISGSNGSASSGNTHSITGTSLLQNSSVSSLSLGAQLLPNSHALSGNQMLPGSQPSDLHTLLPLTTTSNELSNKSLYSSHSYSQQSSVNLNNVSQASTGQSPFSVPGKSPLSSLPRASPSPHYAGTPSPHPAAPSPNFTRSPAPSPHGSISMRSPASLTPSPAPTSSTSQIVSSTAHIVQNSSGSLVQGVVGNVGVMQGLVSQLSLHQMGAPGSVVLPATNITSQSSGGKQVVQTGQLIQLVSTQNAQTRQPIIPPIPKPIQPKQPQLLPKPLQQTIAPSISHSSAPKTAITPRQVTSNAHQPIVISAPNHPTAVLPAGQQNLGSIVINSPLLQSSIQQPILIQQPNGLQLLVRPSGTAGQTLLLPMPAQPHVVTTVGKATQPQAVVIPGNGQTPALVIPQGITASVGPTGVIGAAQGSRAPQLIRLVTPAQPQLQFQQINTPNGPTLLAIPTGQAVSIPGMLTSNAVRTIAPQVASGTLHIVPSSQAPSVSAVGTLQVAANPLQVNTSGHALQLASSAPSVIASKPSVIEETITVNSTIESQQKSMADLSKNNKRRPKKKKKEKATKEKLGNINLNDILKEAGIVGEMLFEDSEIGDTVLDGSDTNNISLTSEATQVNVMPTITVQSPSSSCFTKNVSSSGTIVTNALSSQLLTSLGPVHPGMCLAVDSQGKLILNTDLNAAVAGNHIALGSQVSGLIIPTPDLKVVSGMTPSALPNMPVNVSVSSSKPENTVVIGGLPTQQHFMPVLSCNSLSSIGTSVTSSSDLSFGGKMNSPEKIQIGSDISKIAQNTHLLQSVQPDRIQVSQSPSIFASVITGSSNTHPIPKSNGVPLIHSVSRISSETGQSTYASSESVSCNLTADNIPFSVVIPSHSSSNQVPTNSAVIVSSNGTNNYISGVLGHKNLISNSVLPNNSKPSVNSEVLVTHSKLSPNNNYDKFAIQDTVAEEKNKTKLKKKKKDVETVKSSPSTKTKLQNISSQQNSVVQIGINIPNGINSSVVTKPPISIDKSVITSMTPAVLTTTTLTTSSSTTTQTGLIISGQKQVLLQPGQLMKQLIIPQSDKEVSSTQQQSASVKYPHQVGHKIITLTPKCKQSASSDSSTRSSSQNSEFGKLNLKTNEPVPSISSLSNSVITSANMQTSLSSSSLSTNVATQGTVSPNTNSHRGMPSSPFLSKSSTPQCSPVLPGATQPSLSSPQNPLGLYPQISPGGPVTSPDSPARQSSRVPLFEHQLRTDQNGALNPDFRTPFKHKTDACKRLIRYHVYSDRGPSQKDLEETDAQCEIQTDLFQRKLSNMVLKYQALLLKDSMRRHSTAELVMLYRLYLQEERNNIEKDRLDIKLALNLSSPPAHWLSGEVLPQDSPFPWEDEWNKEKVYVLSKEGGDVEDEWKGEEEEPPLLILEETESQEHCCGSENYSSSHSDNSRERDFCEEQRTSDVMSPKRGLSSDECYDNSLTEVRALQKPKKLKIRLKAESHTAVPPLRIKTDVTGALKLTLKKQEGTSEYYRVGEDLCKEYVIDQENVSDDPQLQSCVLRESKVVLEDVLKTHKYGMERSTKKKNRKKHGSKHEARLLDQMENSVHHGYYSSECNDWVNNRKNLADGELYSNYLNSKNYEEQTPQRKYSRGYL